MSPFDYVAVIISVVIGLGLSHLLTGLVKLVKGRRLVRFYWIHLVWVALSFMGHVFLWWTLWNLRRFQNWDFFTFLLLLLEPVLLFVSVAFLIPEPRPGEEIDLREYFYENRAAFFGVNAVFTLLMIVINGLLLSGRFLSPPAYVMGVMTALHCGAAVTKNERFHAAVALLFTLLFVAFVFSFGLRLRG